MQFTVCLNFTFLEVRIHFVVYNYRHILEILTQRYWCLFDY